MSNPTLRAILSPRRRSIVLLFLCVSFYSPWGNALFSQSGGRASRPPDSEAVCQLRRVLIETYPSPAERDRAIKQCLPALRSLADWQRAAMLTEWDDSATNEEAAMIDRANHTIVLERFTTAVRGLLRRGEPASATSTMEMLGRMAALARDTGEPLTLVHGFAPDLADLVIQGPPSQRGLAARTLAQVGPPVFVAVPALSELLRADDGDLRRAAADSFALLIQNALQAMGDSAPVLHPAPRSDLVLVASTVLPAVHAGLEDARPEVRRRCLQTIGLACAALSQLMAETSRSEQPSLRRPLEAEHEELRPLLQVLRDQGPILERFLHDEDAEARILTHQALEELGIARERWLRHCAARREKADEKLLAELLHAAVPRLAEELAHPDVRVRRSALNVLEMSGSLALPALPALSRALGDPDRFVRWSAVRTVGKLGPCAAPQTLSNLTKLLNDPDEELRQAAADALERLRSPTP
jgi:hypothetical protein